MKEALTHSETDKMSPIAYYVYFYISNAGQTKTSMMGEKKDKSTFASNASSNRKMIAAWRYMREGTLDFMRWLKFHWCDYREYSDRSYPVIPQELSSMVNQFGI
jgi:hypothetical protein